MADDLGTLQLQLANLREAQRSGATRVQYEGKSVDYRSAAEMAQAIAALENTISRMSGRAVRHPVVRSQKGW